VSQLQPCDTPQDLVLSLQGPAAPATAALIEHTCVQRPGASVDPWATLTKGERWRGTGKPSAALPRLPKGSTAHAPPGQRRPGSRRQFVAAGRSGTGGKWRAPAAGRTERGRRQNDAWPMLPGPHRQLHDIAAAHEGRTGSTRGLALRFWGLMSLYHLQRQEAGRKSPRQS
jgi:hypothetical protein